MSDTVLVTGATGTVGAALVDRLADTDLQVRAGVHSPDAASDLPEEVEPVELELTDPESLAAAFEGVDRAYLLTPLTPDQPSLVENAVEAAVEADVDHLVRQSARGTGAGEAPHPLAADHRAAERAVEGSGLAWTHVRPTSFMQNVLGNADTVREQGAIYNPVGEPVSYVDARDVAAVAATVLVEGPDAHGGEAYPVTGPEALTYGDIAATLSTVLDREVEHVQVSMADARAGMLDSGMPEPVVDRLVGLLRWLDDGNGRTVVDTVPELTGEPARSFETFAREHAAAFR